MYKTKFTFCGRMMETAPHEAGMALDAIVDMFENVKLAAWLSSNCAYIEFFDVGVFYLTGVKTRKVPSHREE